LVVNQFYGIFGNTVGLFESREGGFFLRKNPLSMTPSVYTFPENVLDGR
jgi:hypothetical protein